MARCPSCHRRLAAGQPCPTHGQLPERPSAEPPPPPPAWTRPLGPLLGSGGFAAVYAIDDGDRGAAVWKVAHADHDLARRRIAREAEALGSIGSPAVPALIDSGVSEGRGWIAMERVDGETLSDLLVRGVPDAAKLQSLSLGILDAVARIHAAHFLHRDLKPDNIVVRPDGRVVVLDLGLARKYPDDPDDPTRANVQVGSLEYMAPEQLAASNDVDVRTDLYGVGCVVYELCTGRPPFVGDAAALSRAHAALRPTPASVLAPGVSPVIEALCADCLAKDPARRPASAGAARARLIASVDAQTSMSVHVGTIAQGRQPVVLVWVELARVDRAILATLAARRALVVSQRGRRVLAALLGADHPDPAAAAVTLARELAAGGARVAIHLDSLVVDDGAVSGAAIDKPESWLPAGTWTGIALTHGMTAIVREPTRPAPELGAGVAVLSTSADDVPLLGRDALLADLEADAAAVLLAGAAASPGPALALLVGDAGVGKTALATELARRLGELGARVHVGTIPPQGSGKPATSALVDLIGEPGAGPTVRVVGDALRAAARERPLAVILDDLHHADHDLLDALEYATLGGEPMPLWVLCTAVPRFDARRPGFGRRAERPRRDALPPLADDDAVALAAALLRPAEYPPLRSLRKLASIARGNPLHLVVLARDLRERGAIRTRPTGEAFFETTVLDSVPPIALGPWLATRALAGLGPETIALARLCAVLGDDFAHDEPARVIAAVEHAGGATTSIDADVGLAELVAAGVLVAAPDGWRFPQALVWEGVYATTEDRDRRAVHAAALAVWWDRAPLDAQPDDALARIARHAEALEDRARAARAFAVLGERASRAHRVFDAHRAWDGAIRNGGERDRALCLALVGRARARYRLQRVRDALADLASAVALAADLGDTALELEIALEQGIVLDWAEDYAASAAAVERARARIAGVGDPAIRARLQIGLDLGAARASFRDGAFDDCIPKLAAVVAAAHAASLGELETIAQLLLAPALTLRGRLDDAVETYTELVARCTDTGDLFHLAAAYVNRAWLWSVRGEIDRTVADLLVVIKLAREDGQPTIERAATYNLAEDRLWQGRLDESLELARRCLALQQMHGEGSTALDLLLIARNHAARGDDAALAGSLGQIGDSMSPPYDDVVRVLACAASHAAAPDWERPLRAVDGLVEPELQMELAVLAARRSALPEDLRAKVRGFATRHPTWSRRIDEL